MQQLKNWSNLRDYIKNDRVNGKIYNSKNIC